jgi:hypothetical protein
MFWSIVIAIGAFALGYLTCGIFYFWKSSATSLQILKLSHLIYFTIMTRSLEYYYYAHINKLQALRINDKGPEHSEYKQAKIDHEKQIEIFKKNSVACIIETHPALFKDMIEFDDWRSAMRFINRNKQIAILFTKEDNE